MFREIKLLDGVHKEALAVMVEAEIAFLAPSGRRPVFHDTPSERDFLPLERHVVSIRPVGDERARFTLDRDGVEIVRSSGRLEYEPPGRAGRDAYLRRLEAVVVGASGAAKVVALGNGVLRRSERSTRHLRDGTTVPGRFAHCDFTPAAAGSRLWVERSLPAEEARERLTRRFAIYNVWRCLTDPPQDTPLAFCEPASVAPSDIVGCDEITTTDGGELLRFELSLYHHHPSQRWFYFPNLGQEELLLFTGYDADPSRPQGVAHAAFTDPTCSADVPARESIDERVIAFFD